MHVLMPRTFTKESQVTFSEFVAGVSSEPKILGVFQATTNCLADPTDVEAIARDADPGGGEMGWVWVGAGVVCSWMRVCAWGMRLRRWECVASGGEGSMLADVWFLRQTVCVHYLYMCARVCVC
jgi:hypothetical protein